MGWNDGHHSHDNWMDCGRLQHAVARATKAGDTRTTACGKTVYVHGAGNQDRCKVCQRIVARRLAGGASSETGGPA